MFNKIISILLTPIITLCCNFCYNLCELTDDSDIKRQADELICYRIEEQNKIQSDIESYIVCSGVDVSFFAQSLIDQEISIGYKTEKTYFSACVIKAAYALWLCKYCDENNISELTRYKYISNKHYYHGSGRIKNSKDGTEYTLNHLITQMINISDNSAYVMLLDYFGNSNYNEYISSIGCSELSKTNMWVPQAKVQSFTKVWTEIYEYFKTNTRYSQILYSACTNSPFNYFTKNFKADCDYSHKSGDGDVYNDAGIIWVKDKPYVLAIFSKKINGQEPINQISTISNKIYDYMTI